MKLRTSTLRSVCLLLGMLYSLPGLVWAHAIIVESSPGINEVVTSGVLEIKLRFNVRIDGARSKVTLVLPDGTSRTVDFPQQPAPDLLTASVPKILPGKYQLHWQVLASDGHITQGDIPFTVITR